MRKDHYARFDGIVLFTRKYKENDLLIKIFTKEFGKRMFFIRNIQRTNNGLREIAFPYLRANFVGRINDKGFSFLSDVGDRYFPKTTIQNIEANAYAAYMVGLTDAAFEDFIPEDPLFDLLWQGLEKIEAGVDPTVVANIFEIQILPKFGVTPNFKSCAICGNTQGNFDYSMQYAGVLCEQHFHMDERRLHWSRRASYFIRMFSQIPYAKLGTVSLGQQTKSELRHALDMLYEEYVGIHLKSHHFISQMESFINPLDDKQEKTYDNS
ncbi:MAG: DNA repair protein RecO [Aerococcus viridans]|nr:MAG: DNA repair protein RecO [Aerococcus viridans]